MISNGVLFCVAILLGKAWCYPKGCRGLEPDMVEKPPSRNDVDLFILTVSGKPKNFFPNERYNITLQLNPLHESRMHKFKHFIVAIETHFDENNELNDSPGKLEIGKDGLSRFSDSCENTLVESNTVAKTKVEFGWRAPSSGCVLIRASVVESKDIWYTDTEDLRKLLCKDSEESGDVMPLVLSECCACNEAKYEMAFEGKWTRNTHPKSYPADPFATHFSDVVGASHKFGHSFWKLGNKASEGLAELAVNSTSSTLEQELNKQNENIRTIIKARGLRAPSLTDTTYALLRVDKENHLVSLVSRFAPSPDWFVGVHDLELCTLNCTWEESRIINLYPYDAGVMDGISYESPKTPVYYQEMIKRITSTSPNDNDSPFFDESGEDMKPIAKLKLTRQKIYEKTECTAQERSGNFEACATTPWTEFSYCSKSCGYGYQTRRRAFLDYQKSYDCVDTKLIEKKRCKVQDCEESDRDSGANTDDIEEEKESSNNSEDDECNRAPEWSAWSECSISCGKGHRVKDIEALDKENSEDCKEKLQITEECEMANGCRPYEEKVNVCDHSRWMPWSTCNATCDTSGETYHGLSEGYRTRYGIPMGRLSKRQSDDDPSTCLNMETAKCYIRCSAEDVNRPINGLPSDNHIVAAPDGEVTDCETSSWSRWTECVVENGEDCGSGWKSRSRSIVVHPQNGGKPCPNKLYDRKVCEISCKKTEETDKDVCVMGSWSKWTPCTNNCGQAYQIRTRPILNWADDCGTKSRMQKRMCPLSIGCDPFGNPNFQ